MAFDSLAVDEPGLTRRNELLRAVYFWMMIGMLVSALIAFVAAHSTAMQQALFGNPYTIWFLIAIELGLVIAISAAIEKISVPTARWLLAFRATQSDQRSRRRRVIAAPRIPK